MDRREFLITSGGAAAAVAGASPAAVQAEESHSNPHVHSSRSVPLKLAMPWADTPQGPADNVRRFARRIEAMTDGRHRIEIVSTAGAGPDSDADIVHGSQHDFGSRNPAFAYFAGLPGSSGLAPQDLAHWIAVGGGQMLWDDLAARYGWKPLLIGHSGDTPPLWSREPIAELSDLAGQRISAPGLGGDVARALGAEAQESLLPHEAAGALARGSLFAAEAGDLATSLAAGLPRAARHATGSGFNGCGTALSLSFRLSVWERLSGADQAVIAAAAAEEFQLSLAESRAHAGVARHMLERHLGVSFAPWPADVAEAIDRVAEATIAHVAGQDAVAARIDQSYMAFRSMISATPASRPSTPVA